MIKYRLKNSYLHLHSLKFFFFFFKTLEVSEITYEVSNCFHKIFSISCPFKNYWYNKKKFSKWQISLGAGIEIEKMEHQVALDGKNRT